MKSLNFIYNTCFDNLWTYICSY